MKTFMSGSEYETPPCVDNSVSKIGADGGAPTEGYIKWTIADENGMLKIVRVDY